MAIGQLLAALVVVSASRAFAGGGSSTPAALDAAPSSPHLCLSLGVGDTSIGPAALASVSVDWSHLLFRVRAGRTTSFNLEGPPAVAITDYSALVGGIVRTGPVRLHGALGIGAGSTTRRGPEIVEERDVGLGLAPPEYAWVRHDTIVNMPVQLGVSLDSEYTGIGLDFIANVNREVSTFGWALTFSGGWLR